MRRTGRARWGSEEKFLSGIVGTETVSALRSRPVQTVAAPATVGEAELDSVWRVAHNFRALGALGFVGAASLPLLPDTDLPLCALRAVTGIPCPFCGMTTASIALSRADVGAAFAANPGVFLLIAVIALSFVPRAIAPRRAVAALQRHGRVLARIPFVVLPVLWIWELNRFELF